MEKTSTLLSLLFVLLLVCYVSSQIPTSTVGPSSHPAAVLPSSLYKIGNLSADMYARWLAYDTACDPKAVFTVAYLFMTANAKKLVENNYFDDGNKMVDFIMAFAGRFLDATNEWEKGHTRNVSLPWMVYFNSCESNRSDVTEDITIGMNAHINFDLAVAAYQQGYAVPEWQEDYFRINDLMAQVDDNVTHALGRYDPQFYNTDFVSGTYFEASIQLVTSWRTSAYTTAVGYQNALLPSLVPPLELANEISVGGVGQAIAVPYPCETAPSRIAYCQANHYPLVL